jgi:hypothetical protein
MAVMGHIRSVRQRNDSIDASFAPVIHLLGTLSALYVIKPDDIDFILSHLRTIPEASAAVYKKSLAVREKLAGVQDSEAQKVKLQTAAFNSEVDAFRDEFSRHAAFQYSITWQRAYTVLEQWHHRVLSMELRAAALRDLQEMFDLSPSLFKPLRECRTDLQMLKEVWDAGCHVQCMFGAWMATRFRDVDVDGLQEETRKLTQLVRSFGPKARAWGVHAGLAQQVKNIWPPRCRLCRICDHLRCVNVIGMRWWDWHVALVEE